MWYCNPQGLPQQYVTIKLRELLPHVFTLSRHRQVVIFCGTFCYSCIIAGTPSFSEVQCSVLPGLSSPNKFGATEHPAANINELNPFSEYCKGIKK